MPLKHFYPNPKLLLPPQIYQYYSNYSINVLIILVSIHNNQPSSIKSDKQIRSKSLVRKDLIIKNIRSE